MADNTRMQTMQSAINKLTEQSDGFQKQLQTRDVLLDSLKQNIQKAQLRMKIQADHHRRELEYNVGDFVYVKLQPYRQHSLRLIWNQKLSMRYFGPFPIIERIGPVAYKLLFPSSAHIHPIFHVSVLKKCEGPPQPACLPESLILNEKSCPLQPQSLLGNRMIKKNAQWQEEVLIQWQGMTTEKATWEHFSDMQGQYPHFNLEDKVLFNGGGNDTNTLGQKGKGRRHVARNSVKKQKD